MFDNKSRPIRPTSRGDRGNIEPWVIIGVAPEIWSSTEKEGLKNFLANPIPETIDRFARNRAKDAFQPIGWSDKDQLWKHPKLNGVSQLIAVRRTGEKFIIQAAKGVNVIVFYKGDPGRGINAAALVCRTLPGEPPLYAPKVSPVFEGADFLEPSKAPAEFAEIRKHINGEPCTCGPGLRYVPRG